MKKLTKAELYILLELLEHHIATVWQIGGLMENNKLEAKGYDYAEKLEKLNLKLEKIIFKKKQ